MTDTILHQPVLLHEVIDLLNIQPQQVYLDCTVGSAGHAIEIVKKGGRLYGLDVDPKALNRAKERLTELSTRLSASGGNAFFRLYQFNFSRLKEFAKQVNLTAVSGILMDLGLSSEQLADKTRGFSFNLDAPLDMRADPNLKVTAADLVNGLNKGELHELFQKLGQEHYSLPIADSLVRSRRQKPINTTLELAQLLARVKSRRGKIHPATQVFQALRIAVNDELNNLTKALPQAVELLRPHGRLIIISFHSLEDRIVKNYFKTNQHLKILTKKPIQPSIGEINQNPRSRSAKLRAAEKI